MVLVVVSSVRVLIRGGGWCSVLSLLALRMIGGGGRLDLSLVVGLRLA